MTFKPALLFIAIVFAIFLVVSADRSFAQNPPGEPVDATADVTLVKDNLRIQERNAGVYQMDASVGASGFYCTSCQKDMDPAKGYEPKNEIVPSDTDSDAANTKATKTKK